MTAGDPHREAARRSPGHGTWPAGHYRRSLPVRPLRRQGRRSAGFQDLNSQALHHHATLSSSRAASIRKIKGVGERPGSDPPALPCRGRRKISVPSPPLSPQCADWRPNLVADALCRRSRPAVSKHDGIRSPPFDSPARLTQSSTSFEVEDCEAARAYFFFRRLVFFAFFRHDFVFVFRFFAMLPS